MSTDKSKPAPGDGLRSLRSTPLFRAINYELYVKPNKAVMIFGTIAMLGCIGYFIQEYYNGATSDKTVEVKKKVSKWEI